MWKFVTAKSAKPTISCLMQPLQLAGEDYKSARASYG